MPRPETTFGDAKRWLEGEAKDWLDRIPDLQPTRLVTYPWGTPLPTNGGADRAMAPGEIGIILRGQAEVCEEHLLETWEGEDETEFYATPLGYRPIRLLEPGDLFGDFSLLDEAAFKDSKPSRPFERWNVVFGGRSYIFLGPEGAAVEATWRGPARWSRPDQDLFLADDRTRTLHNLMRNALERESTLVAYVRWRGEEELAAFLASLFPSSWRRAYTYRLASNSYNMRHKFIFLGRARAKLRSHRKKAGNKATHAYRDTVNFSEIAPAFIEAIYDAINRPVRDEPVFACLPIEGTHGGLHNVLRKGRIGRPARISRHPEVSEFYFPIGLSNFLMINYANSMRQMSLFYEGIGVKDCREPVRSDVTRDYHSNGGGKKGSGLYFWKIAADLIIESHINVSTEQDEADGFDRSSIESFYNISCEVFPGFDGRLELFLKYARR